MTKTAKNIAIIGAGIVGLMSARALLKHTDVQITLYNKDGFPPISSASYIAGGMLAPYSEIDHMTPAFIEASLRSIAIWKDFIRNEAPNVPFADHGTLLLAHQPDQHMLTRFETHLPRPANSSVWQRLDRTTLLEKEPDLPEKFNSALYLSQECAIHPMPTIAKLMEQLTHSKRVTLIGEATTPQDIQTKYDYVIDCRGQGAQADQPQLRGIKGEIAIVHNPSITLRHTVRVMHPRYPMYIVPRPDNIYMIGATQIETSEDTQLSLRSTMELLSSLYSLHPSFGDARIIDFMAGIRPAYPDNLPRIIQQNDTIISCNGLYRHGFLLAPILAENICQILGGQQADPLFTQPIPAHAKAAA